MIKGKKILAVIPARGGSKGVPRKNIRMLAGKPLIAWTIEAAKRSIYIDKFIISSEDDEIINIAKSFGCDAPFVRPSDLSEDETPGVDPVLHALEQLPGFDIVVMLPPTSPLRKTQDIDEAIEFFEEYKANTCVAISEVSQNPHLMFHMDDRLLLNRLMNGQPRPNRRQDLPKVYIPNGALYIAITGYLKIKKTFYTNDTVGFVMPRERSHDINEELDFVVCESLWERFG